MNSQTPVAQGRVFRPIVRVPSGATRPAPVRGFTLIEMLVALAITLVMMGAVVTLFGVISQSVSGSRAAIEMSDRLRAARNQLQLDLQGATATMNPPLRPENDEGYLEIIEGQLKDSQFSTTPNMSLFGDIDDVLMFTMRSRGAPFTGKFNDAGNVRMIESPVAEVMYFLAQDVKAPPPIVDATSATPTRLYTLYRRVLLVAPAAVPTLNPNFHDDNDLSVRFDAPGGTPTFYANTLGDLTKRENRFARYVDTADPDRGFPFSVDLSAIPVVPQVWPPSTPAVPSQWPIGRPTSNAFLAPYVLVRTGDDVLLNNVLSFDVQVFDPGGPIYVKDGVALEPSDPGWAAEVSGGTVRGYGAYVDLGYYPSLPTATDFNGAPDTKSKLTAPPYIYDTWSLHYENDGVDQSTPTGADNGTNGLDDGGIPGVVDDIGECDTLPPYSAPLRGLRVRIRVYEPSSQVVREAIVVQSFLPE